MTVMWQFLLQHCAQLASRVYTGDSRATWPPATLLAGPAQEQATVEQTTASLVTHRQSTTQRGAAPHRLDSGPVLPANWSEPGRPRGEQGRPDQLFRRGLGQSGSVRFPCAVTYIGN